MAALASGSYFLLSLLAIKASVAAKSTVLLLDLLWFACQVSHEGSHLEYVVLQAVVLFWEVGPSYPKWFILLLCPTGGRGASLASTLGATVD